LVKTCQNPFEIDGFDEFQKYFFFSKFFYYINVMKDILTHYINYQFNKLLKNFIESVSFSFPPFFKSVPNSYSFINQLGYVF